MPKQKDAARRLTLVMAYYENGGMLDVHLKTWLLYPDWVRERLEIILVDDGSPKDPAIGHVEAALARDSSRLPQIQLYRIKPDIPWNQNGARNLAMKQSKGLWHLLTDMDHLLRPDQAVEAMTMRLKRNHYYVPARERAVDDKPYHRHPNSFFVEREIYWEAGGYDEDFCGHYGSDAVFRRILDAVAVRKEVDVPVLTLFGREVIPDASTTNYGRKNTEYHSANNPALVAKRKGAPTRAKNHIRFEWERLV